MKSRPDFLVMDMEEVTRDWNVNFIYDFLYHVRNISDIDLTIEWLAENWADKHQYYDTKLLYGFWCRISNGTHIKSFA